MAIAVIKTGGKQYKVQAGDEVKIEKIEGEKGASANFAEVLLIADDAGENVEIGNPLIAGKSVEAEIMEQGRTKKIHLAKFKSKVRYKRTLGHRQAFTEVKITKIG